MDIIQQTPERNLCDDYSFSTPVKLFSYAVSFLFDRIYYNLHLTNPCEVLKNDSYSLTINQELFASDFGLDRRVFMKLFQKMEEKEWLDVKIIGKKKCNILTPKWKQIIKDIYEAGGHLRPIWSKSPFDVNGKPTQYLTWETMLDITEVKKFVPVEEKLSGNVEKTSTVKSGSLYIEAKNKITKQFGLVGKSFDEVWRKHQTGLNNLSMTENDYNSVTFKVCRELTLKKHGNNPNFLDLYLFPVFKLSQCWSSFTVDYIKMKCDGKEWNDLTIKSKLYFISTMSYEECSDYVRSMVEVPANL